MSGSRNNEVGLWLAVVAVVMIGFSIVGVGTTSSAPVVTSVPAAAPPVKAVTARPAEVVQVPATPAVRPALSEEKLKAIMIRTVERGRVDMPLRMAEHKAGLQLTDEQHERLLDDVMDFEHVRAQTERALVKVKSFDGTTLALQIPAYPDQGNVLKAAFVKQVGSDFPPAIAEDIERALAGPLSTIFGGFGRFSQDNIVTVSPGGDIHIRFYAGVAGDVKAADAATLEQAQQLTGDASVGRDALVIFHEAIAEIVLSHFPAK